jgi:endonuclease G
MAWAYWVENTDEAQMNPPISYAELVQKTGIDFHLPLDNNENKLGKQVAKGESESREIVGGWYPVFFDQYSAEKVAAMISNIKAGRISSVQIQYDHNAALAQKIFKEIQAQGLIEATISQSSPSDSSTVSYERNRVTVIVRSK